MQTESVDNPIKERIVRGTLANGMTVLLNPRPGFTRTFGVVSTRFGSLDNRMPGTGQRFPDGVAHFLEHKLFEDEDGDVSLRFSERGASCNAGTEFTKTSYHFSCVDQVEANLDTLLRFVLQPYFTDESVAKEQGIIEQEIRMYDDDADWRIFFQLLESMYHQHPVRLNIAGSVESIREITPETLYQCHRVFYHPANMVLSVSGGFDEERVLQQLGATVDSLPANEGSAFQRPRVPEPAGILRQRQELAFAVSRPMAYLGFKDQALSADPAVSFRRDMVSRLLLDVLFSQSSDYHQSLYESGAIDDTFDASYSGEDDFGFTALASECDDPDAWQAAMFETLADASKKGIPEDGFSRMRRRFLGRYIRTFNSVEATAGSLVGCHFRGIEITKFLDLANSITSADLEERLREHLQPEQSSLSILWPLEHPRAQAS